MTTQITITSTNDDKAVQVIGPGVSERYPAWALPQTVYFSGSVTVNEVPMTDEEKAGKPVDVLGTGT
jgi:hypothetical protein